MCSFDIVHLYCDIMQIYSALEGYCILNHSKLSSVGVCP